MKPQDGQASMTANGAVSAELIVHVKVPFRGHRTTPPSPPIHSYSKASLLTEGVVLLGDALDAAGIQGQQLVQGVHPRCSQPPAQQLAYARKLHSTVANPMYTIQDMEEDEHPYPSHKHAVDGSRPGTGMSSFISCCLWSSPLTMQCRHMHRHSFVFVVVAR